MSRQVLHRVLYGTTAPDPWQQARLTIRPAVLHGYARHKVRHADYPALVAAAATTATTTTAATATTTTTATQRNDGAEGPAAPADCGARGRRGEGVSEGASGSVRGTLVSGLAAHDLFRLDVFEGDEYERRRVTAFPLPASASSSSSTGGAEAEGEKKKKKNDDDDNDGGVDAETYVWTAGAQRLESGEWDFEAFAREKLGRWVGEGEREDFQGERPSFS
ncbi:MAG: hypothetical protein LQ340_003378, partial [Diploschistes diacapsis]